MENVFFLFPVKEGLPDSHAHPILQRPDFPNEEDTFVMTSLDDACRIADDLCYASRNTRAYYFSENVVEFCAGINKGSDYPDPITLIRSKFSKKMSDVSFLVPDSGEHCFVFQAPVSGKDYFARIVDCGLSRKAEGSMLCALPADSRDLSISVCVNKQEVSLDGRAAKFLAIVDWLSCHHHPARVFEPNPKHEYEHRVTGGDIAGKWPYDDATSQSYLDKAFVDGKRLAYCTADGEIALIFDEHEENHYHGHVDDLEKLSNKVQKLLKSA